MTDTDTDEDVVHRIEVVVPTGDLHGWPVRTEGGELLGHVREVHTNGDGELSELDVRERWILGPVHRVPAGGMRLEHGEVVVPSTAAGQMLERELEWQPAAEVPSESAQRQHPKPVWIQGRERAERRFGGVDLLASLLGALAAFAVIVLVGGALRAGLELGPWLVDTSASSFNAVTTDNMLATALTLAAGGLVGGWAAGRASRFDGIANGLLAMAFLMGAGALATWMGRSNGADWDMLNVAGLPTVEQSSFDVWGTVAFLLIVALMLAAAGLGGAIGESWHRTADRLMLDVVAPPPGERHRPPRRRKPKDGMP